MNFLGTAAVPGETSVPQRKSSNLVEGFSLGVDRVDGETREGLLGIVAGERVPDLVLRAASEMLPVPDLVLDVITVAKCAGIVAAGVVGDLRTATGLALSVGKDLAPRLISDRLAGVEEPIQPEVGKHVAPGHFPRSAGYAYDQVGRIKKDFAPLSEGILPTGYLPPTLRNSMRELEQPSMKQRLGQAKIDKV